MSFWKKSMEYLGLGPDDAYDDYDEGPGPEPAARHSRSSRDDSRASRAPSRSWPAEPDSGTVKAVPTRPSFPSRDFDASRRSPMGDESGVQSRPSKREASRSASPPAPNAEPATVRPRRFDQAQELADRFKEGNSVILNLESAERDVARRLIDFASGVCYSLDGTM
ncbi:hypothetical protein BH24ACT5_BH24ACT5_15970 [soil metagenome]